MINLHQLECNEGSRHRTKRLGCGKGSGHGKTCTRGHKGQGSRSGGGKRIGFEGGQMPLYRRIPKRGFNNQRFSKQYSIVNVKVLNSLDEGSDVSPKSLLANGVLRKLEKDGLKILAKGDLARNLNISAHAFTQSAREKIEKAGGKCTVLR